MYQLCHTSTIKYHKIHHNTLITTISIIIPLIYNYSHPLFSSSSYHNSKIETFRINRIRHIRHQITWPPHPRRIRLIRIKLKPHRHLWIVINPNEIIGTWRAIIMMSQRCAWESKEKVARFEEFKNRLIVDRVEERRYVVVEGVV